MTVTVIPPCAYGEEDGSRDGAAGTTATPSADNFDNGVIIKFWKDEM